MNPNLAQLVADEWDRMLDECPDPLTNPMFDIFGRLTYRERLDRQPWNYRGKLIPRIVTVRRHLRELGKPPRPPRLPA